MITKKDFKKYDQPLSDYPPTFRTAVLIAVYICGCRGGSDQPLPDHYQLSEQLCGLLRSHQLPPGGLSAGLSHHLSREIPHKVVSASSLFGEHARLTLTSSWSVVGSSVDQYIQKNNNKKSTGLVIEWLRVRIPAGAE